MNAQKAVRAVATLILLYSIMSLAGQIAFGYSLFRSLKEMENYKIIIAYPLFLEATIIVLTIAGLICAFGLFSMKRWSRYLANMVLTSAIVLFLFTLVGKSFLSLLDTPLVQSEGRFIYLYGSIDWHGSIAVLGAIGILFILNGSKCKNTFSP